jgi:polyferredoxin
LISYTTLREYNAHAADAATSGRKAATARQKMSHWSSLLRPRTLLYFGLWCAVGLVMLVSLLLRERLDINVLPDRNPLYVTLADGSIRNGYTVKILNMTSEPRTFELALSGLAGATMWQAGSEAGPTRTMAVDAEPDKLREIKVFVSVPADKAAPGLTKFAFAVRDLAGSETAEKGSEFYAPGGE